MDRNRTLDDAELIASSDSSVLVRFGTSISPEYGERVLALFHALRTLHDPRILNLHPAYASLLIDFDPLRCTHNEIGKLIRRLNPQEKIARTGIKHEVPVCYDKDFAPDLAEVCHLSGLVPEQFIEAHTSPEYLVCFLGFTPGFAYLGGLPSALAVPRLATPRKLVPAGSVAIGGEQTGIYPRESPGGWRLIGRTPLRLFHPHEQRPTLLEPGDRIRFVRINRERFEKLAGSWQ